MAPEHGRMPPMGQKGENHRGTSHSISLCTLLSELRSRARNAWRRCSQRLGSSRADQISILLNVLNAAVLILMFVSEIPS